MMRAPEHDIFALTKAFQALTGTKEFVFFPWREYSTLTTEQKRTVVVTQENFNQGYRSAVVPLFTNAVNTMPLYSYAVEATDAETTTMDEDPSNHHDHMDLSTTTAISFLQNHYKAGDGSLLFTHVYKAIGGKIEIVIRKAYFDEAQECLKTVHQDIMYYSNRNTKHNIFQLAALDEADMSEYKPWQPYKWNSHIQPTNGTPHQTRTRHTTRKEGDNKRHRPNQNENETVPTSTITIPSYAKGTYAKAATPAQPTPSVHTTTTKDSRISTSTNTWIEPPDVDFLQKRCEVLTVSHEAQAHRLDQLEKRLEVKMDEKLHFHSQQTQANLTKILDTAEKKIDSQQQDFYVTITLLIQHSIKSAMVTERDALNKTSTTNEEDIDLTGSTSLPQKRGEPTPSPTSNKQRNTQLSRVKPSDWIQKLN